MNKKLSAHDFAKMINRETEEIAKQKGWNYSERAGRGNSFTIWCARTFSQYDQELEPSPDEAVLLSGDLGIDVVFEDSNRKHIILIQCKFPSLAKGLPVDEPEVLSFFGKHTLLSNKQWVRAHGSARAVDKLLDYGERLQRDQWHAYYYFLSTGSASDRLVKAVDQVQRDYDAQALPIRCNLFDVVGIKDLWQRSQSVDEQIPDEVILDLPAGRWITKSQPYKTVLAIIKGNALNALYKQYRESLFAYNIRGYLGNRGINNAIRVTAESEPGKFYYLNNGISAVCTGFHLDPNTNKLIAKKFQIINGAQTVGALRAANSCDNVEILLRVTETQAVASVRGFNEQIIECNNTQNAIKISDFRANDAIQKWLESQFEKCRGDYKDVMADTLYLRKRGSKKTGRGSGLSIRLEDVAKIRYAYRVEPCTGLANPKKLWTLQEDDGLYEDAFGIDGEMVDAWPEDQFQELLLAIALYRRVEELCKQEAEHSDTASFGRLKFHALAMAGDLQRRKPDKYPIKKLLARKALLAEFIDEFWHDAKRVLLDGYTNAVEDQKITVYAFARNLENWDLMKKKFHRYTR